MNEGCRASRIYALIDLRWSKSALVTPTAIDIAYFSSTVKVCVGNVEAMDVTRDDSQQKEDAV